MHEPLNTIYQNFNSQKYDYLKVNLEKTLHIYEDISQNLTVSYNRRFSNIADLDHSKTSLLFKSVTSLAFLNMMIAFDLDDNNKLICAAEKFVKKDFQNYIHNVHLASSLIFMKITKKEDFNSTVLLLLFVSKLFKSYEDQNPDQSIYADFYKASFDQNQKSIRIVEHLKNRLLHYSQTSSELELNKAQAPKDSKEIAIIEQSNGDQKSLLSTIDLIAKNKTLSEYEPESSSYKIIYFEKDKDIMVKKIKDFLSYHSNCKAEPIILSEDRSISDDTMWEKILFKFGVIGSYLNPKCLHGKDGYGKSFRMQIVKCIIDNGLDQSLEFNAFSPFNRFSDIRICNEDYKVYEFHLQKSRLFIAFNFDTGKKYLLLGYYEDGKSTPHHHTNTYVKDLKHVLINKTKNTTKVKLPTYSFDVN